MEDEYVEPEQNGSIEPRVCCTVTFVVFLRHLDFVGSTTRTEGPHTHGGCIARAVVQTESDLTAATLELNGLIERLLAGTRTRTRSSPSPKT